MRVQALDVEESMNDKSRRLVSRASMVRRGAGYDELWKQVDFRTLDIPEEFNLGVACLDDHDPAARALTIVARDRSSRDYTFGQLMEQANRLANALGERGDVVGMVNPASLETGWRSWRCSVWARSRFRSRRCSGPMRWRFGCAAARRRR
jgi:hypothetical protein